MDSERREEKEKIRWEVYKKGKREKKKKKKKNIYLFDISNLNVLCQNWKEGEGSFGVS